MTQSSHTPCVLVTGAAMRIGRVIALEFARSGYDCIVHYNRSEQEARAVCDEIEALGRRSVMVQGDLAGNGAAAGLIRKAVEVSGALPNAFVLSAATYDHDDACAYDPEMLSRQLKINFEFPVTFCAELGKFLLECENVFVPEDISVSTFIDYKVRNLNPDFFSYSVSKHALAGVFPYLAVAYAEKFRVNAICPGPVLPSHGVDHQDFVNRVSRLSITGRVPPAEDVARSAVFLAQNRSMVGQMIFADAGARFPAGVREVVLS